MNISELNNKLFKALEGIEEGTLETDKAKAMVNISTAITNNAKLILQAARMSENVQMANDLFSPKQGMLTLTPDDTYMKKNTFAKKLGYNNLSEAFANMGKDNFDEKFKEQMQSRQPENNNKN